MIKLRAIFLHFLLVFVLVAAISAIPSMGQSQSKAKTSEIGSVNSGDASRGSLEQQLVAKEKMSWGLAIRRDVAAYKDLHAPDFVTVSGNGVTDRVRSETSALDPSVSFERCDFSSFRVSVVGADTALVTYRVKAAGFDHGKKFGMDSFASSIWVSRNGKWLNVFYQATPAAAQF